MSIDIDLYVVQGDKSDRRSVDGRCRKCPSTRRDRLRRREPHDPLDGGVFHTQWSRCRELPRWANWREPSCRSAGTGILPCSDTAPWPAGDVSDDQDWTSGYCRLRAGTRMSLLIFKSIKVVLILSVVFFRKRKYLYKFCISLFFSFYWHFDSISNCEVCLSKCTLMETSFCLWNDLSR